MYWRRRLTRLESALYAAVAAILIGAFLERSFHFMALAERTAMEVTVQHINTGLRLRRAADIVAGRPPPAVAPPDLFAFAFVAAPPNFAGEARAGAWSYDPAGGELVYAPRFRTGSSDEAVRFRLFREGSGLWVLGPADR